jgi:hypothetical protein
MISSVSSSLAVQYAPKKSAEKLDALAIKSSDAAPAAKSDKAPHLNPSLFNKFLKYFEAGDKMADIDHNGMVNVNDCMAFLNCYAAGINPFEQPPASDTSAEVMPDASPVPPTATAGEAVKAEEIATPPVLYAPLTPKAEKPEFAPVLKLAAEDTSPYHKKMLPMGELKQLLDVLS